MAGEWRQGQLGDFITLKRGYDLPEYEREPGHVPVVTSSGISGTHSIAKVKGPGVVMGRYGTLGEVYFIQEDFWPHNTSLYVRDFKGNDPLFISHLLRTIRYQAFSDKSSVPGLNRNDLHLATVSLPPLPEQRAIANILGSLDDKIELNRRMNATLEAIARAIFKSWFVDFDPMRAKAEGRDPGLPEEIAALFPDSFEESALGEIPRGWETSTLCEMIEIHDSKRIPLSRREREARPGPYPYYGATKIMDYIDDYLFDGVYVLMGEDGSVTEADGSPVLQYVWGQFWVNNHAHVLQGKKGVNTEQLYLALKHVWLTPYVTGAVQPKLNQGNMKRIPFVLAPDPVNRAFQQTIEPMFSKIRAIEDESRTLAALRDALLPKLISGEILASTDKEGL